MCWRGATGRCSTPFGHGRLSGAACSARQYRRKASMRVSTMIRISAAANSDGALIDGITNFARQIEARGFPGIWIGDSLGRGRPTLDSLQVLTAIAAVTSKVNLGISVLQ